jgi:glycogen(starch) synthase
MKSRSKLLEFCRYYFFPHHRFDLENTLFYFTSGRYEFKNKGLDVSISALGKLNEKLKYEQSTKSIVTFFIVPMREYGVKKDLFASKLLYRHINHLLSQSQEQVHDQILTHLLEDTRNIDSIKALSPSTAQQMQQLAQRFMKDNAIAPQCTHIIDDEYNNPVIRAFNDAGLMNRPDDRVKVVLYPIYLNGTDELLDMNYYDAINGCHLGLFASFYEPWGYTPLEAAALGVPCVTTTSAGFGQFIANQATKREGIFVLDRLHRSDNDIVLEFTRILYDYSKLTHHERVKHKITAKLLAETADWSKLFSQYLKAYDS